MIANHVLCGVSPNDTNNEIRFLVASAKVDGKALMALTFTPSMAEKQKQYALKVLRSLKREAVIEFFVLGEELNEESTESVFLMNKYGQYMDMKSDCIYVKL